MNICWYEDDDIGIYFSETPNVAIRYVTPKHSEIEIKDINKKPFINLSGLTVTLKDYIESITYDFIIDEGYKWDGATVPRVFWRLIGAKTDPRFLIPSLIHDVLCENHDYVDNDRYFSTCVFERLLFVSKVNPVNRWMIKHSVDNYQKLFGGW